MAIPEAVKKQAQEAEELAKAMMQQQQEEEPAEVIDMPQEEETEETEPEAEVKEEPTEGTAEYWEHKYKVLQGKYNAEVPRLQEENRKLQEELRLLKEKLELLEKFIADSSKPQTADAPATTTVQEDEAVKSLKEDFPEIYNGVVKLLEQFEARIQKLIEQHLQPVQETTEQVKVQSLYAQLSARVPDWQQLNTDPEFLEWLKVADPFSGKTRHELLLEAFNNGDIDRVAYFFNAFKQEKEASKPKPQPKPTLPPQGQSYSPSVSRRTQGRIWTEAEIKDFYTRKALGKISPQEASKIEAEIIAAMREGRVRK